MSVGGEHLGTLEEKSRVRRVCDCVILARAKSGLTCIIWISQSGNPRSNGQLDPGRNGAYLTPSTGLKSCPQTSRRRHAAPLALWDVSASLNDTKVLSASSHE